MLANKGGIKNMSIIEKIKAHQDNILAGKIPDDLEICPKCGGHRPTFKLHEARDRLFLVIVDYLVKEVWSLLGRWKCSLCHTTSTYYPDYAIPYKRYTKDTIWEISKKYVEEEDSTYENVVQNDKEAIVYDSKTNSSRYESELTGSTIWWWLSFIGSLNDLISKAFSLIRQKDPSSQIFREVLPINPRKYRSNKRKKLLQRCIRFFNAEVEFRRLFLNSIFPHFAI